ncbi:RNA polymerase sigma factor [candidate division KSB1 bacterium]|nr:RNA polymerase sigma factor [candidate division KSB1 bacterium]
MLKINTTDQIQPGEPAEKAIPRLWEEHSRLIYNLGLRLCRSPECAQDLVQETFLRAFRNWHQFEGRSSPATWLFAIAMRTHKRVRRRLKGYHTESLANLPPTWEEKIPDISFGQEGPLEEVLRHEAQETIYRAMDSLPIDFRVTLTLKSIVDFSVAEVAEVLGIKEATVKTRVHRARLLLREGLVKPPPRRQASLIEPSQQVCLDLLYANQKALDRGVEFPLASGELCSRCHVLFATLDLAYDACIKLKSGELPEPLRKLLLIEISSIEHLRL